MNLPDTLARLNTYDIILASKSPRRQQLLEGIGVRFRTVNDRDMDEVYPGELKREEIPVYLAKAKSMHYSFLMKPGVILITADTIVWLNDEVIGKPAGPDDAIKMLAKLSGNMHEVFTGVCIKTQTQEILFHAATKVFFRNLSDEEIRYYVNNFKPFDKAGAYGVQEWIGYVAVERIDGSYFNVMGLPVRQLYSELLKILG